MPSTTHELAIAWAAGLLLGYCLPTQSGRVWQVQGQNGPKKANQRSKESKIKPFCQKQQANNATAPSAAATVHADVTPLVRVWVLLHFPSFCPEVPSSLQTRSPSVDVCRDEGQRRGPQAERFGGLLGLNATRRPQTPLGRRGKAQAKAKWLSLRFGWLLLLTDACLVTGWSAFASGPRRVARQQKTIASVLPQARAPWLC